MGSLVSRGDSVDILDSRDCIEFTELDIIDLIEFRDWGEGMFELLFL